MNAPFAADNLDLMKFGVGQPVPRQEDPTLLKGEGSYSDDISLQNQVWCVMVRSQVAHGIIKGIDIEEDRFGFEPEVTAKIAALHCRVYEVGISYYGRTYADQSNRSGWRLAWRAAEGGTTVAVLLSGPVKSAGTVTVKV